MSWFNLFKRKEKHRVFDYRKSMWGWHAEPFPSQQIYGAKYTLTGHGLGMKLGDFILLNGTIAPYHLNKIVELRYCSNPTDQWFATVENLGSTDDLDGFCRKYKCSWIVTNCESTYVKL